MKRKCLALVVAAGCTVTGLGTAARAASNLSLSLTGFTGNTSEVATQTALDGAGLNVFSTAAAPAVTFDANGARFGSATLGDGGRNYLRTNVSDYVNLGFVAEITFEAANNDQAFFIGVGTGDTALFGTPDWSTQFSSASFWPELANDKFVRFRTTDDMNMFGDSGVVGGLDAGTHRFRMTFDPSLNQLLGEIDLNYAGGPFVADATTTNLPTDTAPLFGPTGWPGEAARIFFGGDDGALYRDLSVTVIPEPAAMLLAMMGLVAMGSVRLAKRR